VRVCIVYDCLYPHTMGGAERWYRNLAVRLAEEGHEVAYVTMRQWEAGEEPDVPGVRVVAVAPRTALYRDGRRRILPPLRFGLGVLGHLLRRGRRYDVVHTASFPYFSVLAAALVRPLLRFRLVVDWHELWTRAYWSEYLGRLGGGIGWQVQRLCLRTPQRAFCFSRLVERRLRGERVRGEVTVLEGQFAGQAAAAPLPAEPVVVFAGRHIPEKNPVAVVRAVARAREALPGLRAEIYGDGPERGKVLAAIEELELEGVVDAPGFVEGTVIDEALARALCLCLPSEREGYGLVVLEALSRGTPVVLVAGADNAAVEFVVEGENGFVAPSADPADLAAALLRVSEAGAQLRNSALAWFEGNETRLSLDASLVRVLDAYLPAGGDPPPQRE
jgi:glycosyltransferase involved in cell wall biosynthesis